MVIPIWFIIWMAISFGILIWQMVDFLKYWQPYTESKPQPRVTSQTETQTESVPDIDTNLYFTPRPIPESTETKAEISTIITINQFKEVGNAISISQS